MTPGDIGTRRIEQSGVNSPTPTATIGTEVFEEKCDWVPTNEQVIRGAEAIEVRIMDGLTFRRSLAGANLFTALAITQIGGKYPTVRRPARFSLPVVGRGIENEYGGLAASGDARPVEDLASG